MSSGEYDNNKKLLLIWLVLLLLICIFIALVPLIESITDDPALRMAFGACLALLGWAMGMVCSRIFM